MDKPLSRICKCGVCGNVELTTNTVLPYGWVLTWDAEATLCESCVSKWVDRWGTFPPYWIKGEGWNEFEFPEDTSHWRQADFKFV